MEETEPEPTLFALDRYLYRAWFTNLSLTPAGVWNFYEGRAGMEPRIRELREDYALRKIPTRAFAANALYLEVVRLAYNLVTAFQRTCLPEEWQASDIKQAAPPIVLAARRTHSTTKPAYLALTQPARHPRMDDTHSTQVHKLKPLEG